MMNPPCSSTILVALVWSNSVSELKTATKAAVEIVEEVKDIANDEQEEDGEWKNVCEEGEKQIDGE